jgi:uncharacterized membrane protein YccC
VNHTCGGPRLGGNPHGDGHPIAEVSACRATSAPDPLAFLIGLSVLAVTLIGRPGDATTAAITTAVIMVAAVSPHNAWQQPILRFADTVIGVAVGIVAAWNVLRVIRPQIPRAQ